MLTRLLAEIRAGGTLQPAVLAARLGTTPAMVEAMLADLERMGLIQAVSQSCESHCGGCPFTGSCSAPVRLWKLAYRTDEG